MTDANTDTTAVVDTPATDSTAVDTTTNSTTDTTGPAADTTDYGYDTTTDTTTVDTTTVDVTTGVITDPNGTVYIPLADGTYTVGITSDCTYGCAVNSICGTS